MGIQSNVKLNANGAMSNMSPERWNLMKDDESQPAIGWPVSRPKLSRNRLTQ